VTFSPYNKMFVTSTQQNAAFGGLAGADAICAARASSAGLSGTYRAFLSTSTVDARDRMVLPGTTTPARGWVRVDGQPFADQVSDMASGSTSRIYYPPKITELNTLIEDEAFTGSGSLGLKVSGQMCGDWTATTGMGSSGNSADGDRWYYAESIPCGASYRLYCFGVDYATQMLPPTAPSGAKHIFTSQASFTPVASALAQADAYCNSEGQSAFGNTHTFVALLATTNATAASRVAGSTGTWVRPDGIVVFANATDLAAQKMQGAPDQYASGVFTSYPMWSGAPDIRSTGTVQSTCNNWSIGDATVGTAGSPSIAGAFFFNAWTDYFACSTANHLVCIEK
jgi:hypothetical protein